jgi:hypothetical protein
VYYTTKDEAVKAREAMNYKRILKKPIRVTTLATYDREANLFFFGYKWFKLMLLVSEKTLIYKKSIGSSNSGGQL